MSTTGSAPLTVTAATKASSRAGRRNERTRKAIGFERRISLLPRPRRKLNFVDHRTAVLEWVTSWELGQEEFRSDFQAELQRILKATPQGFFVLGEVKHARIIGDLSNDWRQRDINRELTRY